VRDLLICAKHLFLAAMVELAHVRVIDGDELHARIHECRNEGEIARQAIEPGDPTSITPQVFLLLNSFTASVPKPSLAICVPCARLGESLAVGLDPSVLQGGGSASVTRSCWLRQMLEIDQKRFWKSSLSFASAPKPEHPQRNNLTASITLIDRPR
jgi:hypothetical protein